MKKLLVSLMLMFVAQLSFGQTITEFVNTYKSNPSCRYMPVEKDMIPMVAQQAPEAQKPLFKKLTGMEMLMFMGASEDLTKEIKAYVTKLADNGYTVKAADNDGMGGQVVYKMEGDTLKEILFVVDMMGQGVMSMVMKGDFTIEDMKAFAQGE